MVRRRSALLSTYLEDTITVTSAEILALNGTPKELIAAPGAGSYLVIDALEAFNDHGTADYVVNAAGINIRYTTGGVIVANFTEAWGEASSDALSTAQPSALADVPANSALEVHADVADPTTGDGDWLFRVSYRVVTLP
jgi:hypothetical protein